MNFFEFFFCKLHRIENLQNLLACAKPVREFTFFDALLKLLQYKQQVEHGGLVRCAVQANIDAELMSQQLPELTSEVVTSVSQIEISRMSSHVLDATDLETEAPDSKAPEPRIETGLIARSLPKTENLVIESLPLTVPETEKMLMAEDNKLMAKVSKKQIESKLRADLKVVENGEEAVLAAATFMAEHKQTYPIIWMDVMMPLKIFS